jgi:hypothetical protein
MKITAREQAARERLKALSRVEKERAYTQFHVALLAAEADRLPEQAERYRSLLTEVAALLEFTPQDVQRIEEASTRYYREIERLVTTLLRTHPELPLPEQQAPAAN